MNILARQIYKLQKDRGMSIEEARTIAYEQQVKNGNIIPGTFSLTEKGKEYSNKTSKERDEIRKEKYLSKDNNDG